MPSAIDALAFAQLVQRFGELVDEWEAGGGGTGGSGIPSIVDLAARGLVLDGVTTGQEDALEAIIADLLDDHIANRNLANPGRVLHGEGTLPIGRPVKLFNAAADLPTMRFQATEDFDLSDDNVAVTIGQNGLPPSPGSSEAYLGASVISTDQTLLVWGGDRTRGQRTDLTGVRISNYRSPNNRIRISTNYFGVGVTIEELEKNRVDISAQYCGYAFEFNGSADSNIINVSTADCNGIYRLVKGPNGSDVSAIIRINAESMRPTYPPQPVILDEGGKGNYIEGIQRGFKGQDRHDGILVDQEENDGADTFGFNNYRFTTANGHAISLRRVNYTFGEVSVRLGTDASLWNAAAGTTFPEAVVPVPTVSAEQVKSAAGFRPIVVGSTASYGVEWGGDTYWSRNAVFGRVVAVMGGHNSPSGPRQGYEHRPKIGIFPYLRPAWRLRKNERCWFPSDDVHGRILLEKGLLDCSFDVPPVWVQTGYDMDIEEGGRWGGVVRGRVPFDDIVNAPWRTKLRPNQTMRLESVDGLDGMAVTVRKDGLTLEGQHRCSTLSLEAEASPLNRFFRRTGLMVAPETGARAGEPFVVQPDGSFRSLLGGASITAQRLAVTSALIGLMGATPSTTRINIYDRFLFELADMGLLEGAAVGHMFGVTGATDDRFGLFPREISGTRYNAVPYGTPVWNAKRGIALQPPVIVVASAPAAGTTLTVTAENGDVLTVTFADAATSHSPSTLTSTVDRRTSLATIASDTSQAFSARNTNTTDAPNYFQVGSSWFTGEARLRLSGAVTDVQHTAGAALTLNAWSRYGTGWSMYASPGALSASDVLMVTMASQDNAAYSGSDNGFDMEAANNALRLRLRDSNAAGNAGGLNAFSLPGAAMPTAKMVGAIGSFQFGVEQGNIAVQSVRGTSVTPDLMSYGGSRELFMGLVLRASDLVEAPGGAVRAKDERLVRLFRAVESAFKSVRAL